MRHYSAVWFVQRKQDDGGEKQGLGKGIEEIPVRRAEEDVRGEVEEAAEQDQFEWGFGG